MDSKKHTCALHVDDVIKLGLMVTNNFALDEDEESAGLLNSGLFRCKQRKLQAEEPLRCSTVL